MTTTNLSGQTLGQYELRDLLGKGGMGTVYRAYQANLRREVAVKVISPALMEQAGVLERFTREAHTAAALEHPHIVPVYDYGTQDGISYVVMRLLNGGSLAEKMEGDLTTDDLLKILHPLANALDYAHRKGVIHRDLKPSNILFSEEGTLFLADFGLAKLTTTNSSEQLTGSGTVMGTPAYMAPEMWQNENIGPSADLYAVGILAYALLSGEPPFTADTPYQYMHAHLFNPVPPIHLHCPDLPASVQDVLMRALAKNPDHRYPTGQALLSALEMALQGETPESPTQILDGTPTHGMTYHPIPSTLPPTPLTPPSRSPIRTRGILIGSLVAALLVSLIAFFALNLGDGSDENRTSSSQNNNTPSPTPLEGVPAAQNEILIVIADFEYIDADATRVEPNLEREFERAGVPFVRVHHPIASREEAQQVSDVYQASLVIWGEAARGGVSISYALTPRHGEIGTYSEIDELSFSASDLATFDAHVFQGLDTLYVVYFSLGQVYYYNYESAAALRAFQEAESRLPAGREAEMRGDWLHIYMARVYAQLQQRDEALTVINRQLELTPENPDVLGHRGWIYYFHQQSDEAIADLTGALELAPDNPNNYHYYYYRANLYILRHDFALALEDINRALEINPAFPYAYAALGAYYSTQRAYEDAITAYTQALEVDPYFTFAYGKRGEVYSILEEYDKALADVNKGLEISPEYPALYAQRGFLYATVYQNCALAKADIDRFTEFGFDTPGLAGLQNLVNSVCQSPTSPPLCEIGAAGKLAFSYPPAYNKIIHQVNWGLYGR